MTIVRIGASKKFSDNWESAFGKKKPAKAAAAATRARGKKPVAKKTAKKSAKKR